MPGTFSLTADFEGNRYLAIPACMTARASRKCRDACRDCLPAVTGKRSRHSRRMRNRNFTYLVRGPLDPNVLSTLNLYERYQIWWTQIFVSNSSVYFHRLICHIISDCYHAGDNFMADRPWQNTSTTIDYSAFLFILNSLNVAAI